MTSVAHCNTESPLQPGLRIGQRWILHEPLGSGGHATVYRAEHDELGHSVAIKVLHLDRAGTACAEMLDRFRREARIAARIQHRNVVRVFDFGELDDGSPYYVMELIEGEDLQARIDRSGPLAIASVIDIGLQALAGLSALDELAVVHRDIKPGNVMLRPSKSGGCVVKLVDFGIASLTDVPPNARLTIEGTVLGTPEYMSPEQIRGQTLDCRADLYALGVVLYESVTSELPFAGRGPCATLAMALTQEPPPIASKRSECPEPIATIVMRALAKDPADRWASPLEMSHALSLAATELGLPQGARAWDASTNAVGAVSAEIEVPFREERRPLAEVVRLHHRRPAARAKAVRSGPPPLPPKKPRERSATTLRLTRQARALLPAFARIALALMGLGIATVLGFELTSPAQLAAIEHETDSVEVAR